MTNITQIIEEFKKEFPHSEPYTKFMADFIRQKLEALIDSVPNHSYYEDPKYPNGLNANFQIISDWKQSAKQ